METGLTRDVEAERMEEGGASGLGTAAEGESGVAKDRDGESGLGMEAGGESVVRLEADGESSVRWWPNHALCWVGWEGDGQSAKESACNMVSTWTLQLYAEMTDTGL